MTPMVIALTIVLALVCLANKAFKFDDDVSAPTAPDPWTSIDKVAHLLGGVAICFAYILAGAFLLLAVVLTVAIGLLWEWSQKYFSRRDAIAVGVGAVIALVYTMLVPVVNR